MKTMALDLDDTLNNFAETLQRTDFARDEIYTLSEEVFQDYLAKVRSGWTESSDLLCTEHSFFRSKIHQRCYELAEARADGVRFAHKFQPRSHNGKTTPQAQDAGLILAPLWHYWSKLSTGFPSFRAARFSSVVPSIKVERK